MNKNLEPAQKSEMKITNVVQHTYPSDFSILNDLNLPN